MDREKKEKVKNLQPWRRRGSVWAATHRVDPSVFHLPAGLRFIQSWRAEVRKWLHTESLLRLLGSHSGHGFSFSNSVHWLWPGKMSLCIKADRSLQVTKESAQPGDTWHKAVEGHVHGSRCKPLSQQLHHPPIALHSCQGEKQMKLRGQTGSR